jgi:hypothetical protein
MTDRGQSIVPRFQYSHPDVYDGRPWNDRDIADLREAVDSGDTPEEAAGFLCRSGTVDDVKRKAAELGLRWQS